MPKIWDSAGLKLARMQEFWFILFGSFILKTYFFEAHFNRQTCNISTLEMLLIFITTTINFKYLFRLARLMYLFFNTLCNNYELKSDLYKRQK